MEPMASPSASVPDLWIGVVLYQNPPEQIRRLLDSIRLSSEALGAERIQLSFFDNSPAQGLDKQLGQHAARYRWSRDNLGYGGGHNAMMAEAFASPSTRFYLCLNPDAMLHPDCL